jgi:hypothetical protein
MSYYRETLKMLEALDDRLDDAPEAKFDIEGVARIELANILARALVLLRALAEDEALWEKFPER